MTKKKIAVIFGTRPEAIKLAPVIRALQKDSDLTVDVCVTGQHKEMLQQALETFSITPDFDFSVMQNNQSLAELTAKLLTTIDSYLADQRPDLVLAQGDTATVFSTALACFYRNVPFGHVEAGLRTYNLKAPWPEEGYRVLATRIATLHFAPTKEALATLQKEGVSPESAFHVGNTVIDALHYIVSVLDTKAEEIQKLLPQNIREHTGKMVLITGHRRENFDGGLERLCRAIKTLAAEFPDVQFVYPAHLNPHVQRAVHEELESAQANIHVIAPVSYVPFVSLMQRAYFIITDSGGIQEEAPALGKPVLVTREVTERPEGVESGNARLVGTNYDRIVEAARALLVEPEVYNAMAHARNPYGDGKAAERIAAICKTYLYGTN